MGIVAGIGAAAAGIGAVSDVAGMAGAGSSGGQGGFYGGSNPPPVYIPQAQPTFDQYYQNIVGPMEQESLALPGQFTPDYTSFSSSIYNNPYSGGVATGGVNAASLINNNAIPTNLGAASSLYGGSGAVLNTAFDPQQALYNRAANQTQQATDVALANSGVANTPYGVGTLGGVMGNFNIDWQNAQLQRQISGLGAAGSGYGQASNLTAATPGMAYSAGLYPYQGYNVPQLQNLQTLGGETQGISGLYNLGQTTLNPIQSYLGLGQSATSVGQAGSSQLFNQNASLGQGLGQSLQALGNYAGGSNLFGGSPSPTWGNNYANTVDGLDASNYYGPTDDSGALLYG